MTGRATSNIRWGQAAALTFLLAISSIQARERTNTFTLPQLIDQATRDNKELKAARFAVDIGRARLLQAGLRANPTLDLSSRSDFAFGNEGEYGRSLAISQSFPVAGRILRQKDVARVDVALAEVEVAEAERRLAGEIAADTYRLLVVDRQIDSRTALISIQTTLATTTRQRFKAAEVSELDVNTVQLDRQRLIQERTLLESQRTGLLATLNSRLARPIAAPLIIDEPTPSFAGLPALATLQATALRRRPDLTRAQLESDRAVAEGALAKAQRWEDWRLGLEFSQDKQVIAGAPPQGSNRALGVSVSIPLPLFNRGQGLLAEAEANHDQALARIDALTATIESDVASAYAEAGRLDTALVLYDRSMLPTSASNVRLAQQGYREGLVPVFDVVQAQRQQAELNSAYLVTLDQLLQALVRLHTAVGDYIATTAPESLH